MRQAALVVARLLPRVAEIHVDARGLLLRRKQRVELFDVEREQRNVFDRLAVKFGLNIAPRDAENILTDVDADEIDALLAVCERSQKRAFAAAEVEVQRLTGPRKPRRPAACGLLRRIKVKRTGGKLRPRPFFLSDSQGQIPFSFFSPLYFTADSPAAQVPRHFLAAQLENGLESC